MLTRRGLGLAALAAALPARASGRRVVVAGGGIAEIVCALGARGRLVGADSTALFPTGLSALPQIGYMRSLGAEGVLSLSPDLLLAAHEAGPPEVLKRLERAGVRIARIPRIHDATSLVAAVRAVAASLALREQGETLAAALAADFASLAGIVAALPAHPRVVFVLALGGGAPQAAGRETSADAMLTLAGARNVVDDYRGYRPVSAESLLAAAPEAIVTTSHTVAALGRIAAIGAIPALSVLRAVRERRIVSLDSLYLLGFGPRTAHAARDLAAALQGGTLPSLPHRPWLDDAA
jgi:iron complex transport system substrate-binding protein